MLYVLIIIFLSLIYILLAKENEIIIVPEKKIFYNKVIVYYQNNKYDITNFLSKHPGGKKLLLKYNDQDIENVMKNNHHSILAYQILNQYLIK